MHDEGVEGSHGGAKGAFGNCLLGVEDLHHGRSRSGVFQTTAVTRSGINPDGQHDYSAHSLRAGFITYAHLRGASDRAIAHQTRHRSLASIGTYVRISDAWINNAATELNL